MAIPISDFSLGADALSQRYTRRELEETLNLIEKYGGIENYISFYESKDSNIGRDFDKPRDTAGMDVLSPEYLGGTLKNIPGSAGQAVSGLAQMVTSPIESAQAIYEAGIPGILSGLGERFGTPDEWARGDFSDLKNTIYNDPVGLALEAAPGVGLAGRAARMAGAGRMLGSSKAATAARVAMEKTLPYVENPTKILIDSAVWGGKKLSSKMADVGLLMLEFSTGQSVQSLRAMMDAGALTNAQKASAGLSFYKHIFGDFEIGDKYSPRSMQLIREGRDPSLGVELLTDTGEGVLEKLDTFTPRQLFKSSQKDLAGTQDESRIFGHIISVQDKISERLLQGQQNLQKMLAEDLGPSPELRRRAKDQDWALGRTEGEEWILPQQREIAQAARNKLVRMFDNAGWGIEGDRIRPKLGSALSETEGFSEFSAYVMKLKADLEHMGGMQTPEYIQNPIYGVDNLVKFISGDINDGIMNLGSMVDTFENAASPIQGLARGTSTIVRDLYTDLYKAAGKPEKAAKLNTFIDNQIKLNGVVDELMRTFKSYRIGKGSKSEALDTWQQALENSSIRKGFIDEIENYTGHSLSAPIAGLIARRITPKSLVARGSAVSAAQRAIPAVGATAYTGNPLFLAWLPLTSPKFVGNVLVNFGMKQRFVDYMKAVSRHMHQHPVGKSLAEVDGFIFSMYTALDHIQRYNSQQGQNE